MKRILKYKLPRDGQTIAITANVIKWLNVQEQDGWPMIWVIEDDTGYENEYEIIAWGTGWDFPEELNHCRYMGTAQDGAGYVWHYFMQDKSKSYTPAGTGIAVAPVVDVDYWNNYLTTTPAVTHDYSITISCGDADSAISSLESNVDGITIATSSNTATVKAYTQK